MNTKQIKILVSNGKTQLYHSNFQIINNLSMVMLDDQNLYTVLKDQKGFYIPSSGSSGNRYIQKMVESGERVLRELTMPIGPITIDIHLKYTKTGVYCVFMWDNKPWEIVFWRYE